LSFSRVLGITYLGGLDNFAVGPTRDRNYPALDVDQIVEDLRSNQPRFLVSSVATHLESMNTSKMG